MTYEDRLIDDIRKGQITHIERHRKVCGIPAPYGSLARYHNPYPHGSFAHDMEAMCKSCETFVKKLYRKILKRNAADLEPVYDYSVGVDFGADGDKMCVIWMHDSRDDPYYDEYDW